MTMLGYRITHHLRALPYFYTRGEAATTILNLEPSLLDRRPKLRYNK